MVDNSSTIDQSQLSILRQRNNNNNNNNNGSSSSNKVDNILSKQQQQQNNNYNNTDSNTTSKPHHLLTTAIDVPITYQQPTINDDIEQYIEKPYIARACAAISKEKPYGSKLWSNEKHKTVLQQHCTFFDLNNDNIITPYETYIGFRRIGFNIFTSLLAALCIHLSLSYGTSNRDTYFPDLLLRINLNNIHRGKHGSDSGVYDQQGRFIPYKFEELFIKYDTDHDNALSWTGLIRMAKGQRNALDFAGWAAMCTEWGFTWLLLADKDNKLQKEDIRSMYDGSIFYEIANKRESGLITEQKGLTFTRIIKTLGTTLYDIIHL